MVQCCDVLQKPSGAMCCKGPVLRCVAMAQCCLQRPRVVMCFSGPVLRCVAMAQCCDVLQWPSVAMCCNDVAKWNTTTKVIPECRPVGQTLCLNCTFTTEVLAVADFFAGVVINVKSINILFYVCPHAGDIRQERNNNNIYIYIYRQRERERSDCTRIKS